jgi:hypothetical protein
VRDTYSPSGLTVPLAAKDLRLAMHEANWPRSRCRRQHRA